VDPFQTTGGVDYTSTLIEPAECVALLWEELAATAAEQNPINAQHWGGLTRSAVN